MRDFDLHIIKKEICYHDLVAKVVIKDNNDFYYNYDGNFCKYTNLCGITIIIYFLTQISLHLQIF